MYSLGAKLSVVCAGPRQPPNCWRRCHLPVVVGVLLETNLGILTEGNCCYLHINLTLWVNNEGARSYRAVAGEASKLYPSTLVQSSANPSRAPIWASKL